jgi:hypothetical protein
MTRSMNLAFNETWQGRASLYVFPQDESAALHQLGTVSMICVGVRGR